MHVLEGESLLNDASSLVCMRFAVAAALTGTFSLLDAVGKFLWLAIGGIAIGAGVSWIAAVAKKQQGRVLPVTRIRRSAVWKVVRFTVSGVISVLLGEQLPHLVSSAARVVRQSVHHEPIWLVVYVLAITLALAGLRFCWVWTSLHFALFRAAQKGQKRNVPSWRLIAETSLTGVRGTITLAGALTLPLTMDDGSAFPARNLAIVLVAGVIILS